MSIAIWTPRYLNLYYFAVIDFPTGSDPWSLRFLRLNETITTAVHKWSQHLSPRTQLASHSSLLTAHFPTIYSLSDPKPLRFLERMPYRIILPHPNLLLLLRHHVLHPDLLPVLRYEFPDESRVPQFTGDADVFATTHQRVGFAAFGRGGDGIGREVVHLAARDGYESVYAVSVSI